MLKELNRGLNETLEPAQRFKILTKMLLISLTARQDVKELKRLIALTHTLPSKEQEVAQVTFASTPTPSNSGYQPFNHSRGAALQFFQHENGNAESFFGKYLRQSTAAVPSASAPDISNGSAVKTHLEKVYRAALTT